MLTLMVILVAFILYCFSSSKSLLQGSQQIPRYLLDTFSHFLNTSSIQAFLSRFLGFSQYLLIDSLIHRTKFFGVTVCSIASQYLPGTIKNFCRRHLLDTSRSIKLLFSIEARYLLDLSSCIFYI